MIPPMSAFSPWASSVFSSSLFLVSRSLAMIYVAVNPPGPPAWGWGKQKYNLRSRHAASLRDVSVPRGCVPKIMNFPPLESIKRAGRQKLCPQAWAPLVSAIQPLSNLTGLLLNTLDLIDALRNVRVRGTLPANLKIPPGPNRTRTEFREY